MSAHSTTSSDVLQLPLGAGFSPPQPPDVSAFGKSRVGRKLRKRAFDDYFRALGKWRRRMGIPARSGPPIPGSQPREYYTLDQARHGGQKSGRVRREKAAARHRRIFRLRSEGRSLREIASLVGCHYTTVSRLLNGHIRTVAAVVAGVERTISPSPAGRWGSGISPTLAKLWRGWRQLSDRHRSDANLRPKLHRETRRLRGYIRGMVLKGRQHLVHSTYRFLRSLQDLDADTVESCILSFYGYADNRQPILFGSPLRFMAQQASRHHFYETIYWHECDSCGRGSGNQRKTIGRLCQCGGTFRRIGKDLLSFQQAHALLHGMYLL